MLKENERLYGNFMAIVDVAITLFALVAGYYIRVYTVTKEVVYSEQYLTLALLIIPIWYLLVKTINLQSAQKAKNYSVVFLEYGIIVFIGIMVLFVLIFLLKLDKISRLALMIFAITDLVLLFSTRVLILRSQKKRHIKGKNVKQALLIANDESEPFIDHLIMHKHLGYKIAGIVSNEGELTKKHGDIFRFHPIGTKIHKVLEDEVIDEVIYCRSTIDNEQIKELIYTCEDLGITFQLQSDFFSLIASKSQLNYYGDIPLMTFTNTPSDYIALSAKKVFEQLFSLLALLLFSPFFILITAAIKLESNGSVFFKQTRVGLNGRLFTIYKFRTMVQNAEKLQEKLKNRNEVDGPVFKIKDDPRITKVGRFLRRTSLDEFPQFINVLKGDMAVVGPRPPIPSEVDQYTRLQRRRLSMRPGITCIWQVSGRNDINFEQWMKLDLQYIDNWSLRLDIILILKTINAMFKRTGY